MLCKATFGSSGKCSRQCARSTSATLPPATRKENLARAKVLLDMPNPLQTSSGLFRPSAVKFATAFGHQYWTEVCQVARDRDQMGLCVWSVCFFLEQPHVLFGMSTECVLLNQIRMCCWSARILQSTSHLHYAIGKVYFLLSSEWLRECSCIISSSCILKFCTYHAIHPKNLLLCQIAEPDFLCSFPGKHLDQLKDDKHVIREYITWI